MSKSLFPRQLRPWCCFLRAAAVLVRGSKNSAAAAAAMEGTKRQCGRVFYGQGNDFNNLSSEDASALGSLDTILGSLRDA